MASDAFNRDVKSMSPKVIVKAKAAIFIISTAVRVKFGSDGAPETEFSGIRLDFIGSFRRF